MYPTLYHALLDLTGLDWPALKFLNSFGFFVALAFLAASWTLTRELARKEREGLIRSGVRKVTIGSPATPGELLSNGLIGFLLGWKGFHLLTNIAEATADPQAFLLSAKGSFPGGLAVGALLAWLKWREKEKRKLEEPRTEEVVMHAADHAGNITLTAALWGLIGAKLFHWLENPSEFIAFISGPGGSDVFSGLTMYGGLILAGIMVVRYFVRHGLAALPAMDAAAPGLMLAYAIGRIGCQVSGDGDWGIVNTAAVPGWLPSWLWAYDYPNNVNGVGQAITSGTCFPGYCTHLVPAVFPTPLYETIACLLLAGVLWSLRTRISLSGVLFGLYLMLNGLERFWIEKIRVNVQILGGITQAEIIAVLLFALGAGGIIWLRQRHRHRHAT